MSKYETLEAILKKYEKVTIAYSGGCDSNFLFQVAVKTLGKENVLAILCTGDMMSKEDLDSAREMLQGYWYEEIPVDVFSVDAFKHNDKRRCYYCKKNIMTLVKEAAMKAGITYVLDGKNKDDEGVYRPGNEACQELGICSPLADSHLTKQEVRMYSKELGVLTHDKPSNACLASRFDYDTLLTKEKLERVAKAEKLLHDIGILYVRVRVQEELARVEMEKKYFALFLEHEELVEQFKQLGFRYVTLDVEGIKSGSYDK
jgi:uncharacterized protein (TIGR00268 family)